jgi:hypothetical protein
MSRIVSACVSRAAQRLNECAAQPVRRPSRPFPRASRTAAAPAMPHQLPLMFSPGAACLLSWPADAHLFAVSLRYLL